MVNLIKVTKKKKISATSDSEKGGEGDEDFGQETLSQQTHDEVRMINLIFNSSGWTLLMLTPLGDYF